MIANSKVGGPNPVFSFDHFSQGWRLERGCVFVSPRLTTREMYWWMDGLIEGLQTVKFNKEVGYENPISSFSRAGADSAT